MFLLPKPPVEDPALLRFPSVLVLQPPLFLYVGGLSGRLLEPLTPPRTDPAELPAEPLLLLNILARLAKNPPFFLPLPFMLLTLDASEWASDGVRAMLILFLRDDPGLPISDWALLAVPPPAGMPLSMLETADTRRLRVGALTVVKVGMLPLLVRFSLVMVD